MEGGGVKELNAQVEAVQKEAAAHGLEDGEHVAVGKEEDEMKLDVSESGGEERAEAGKEEGSVAAAPAAVTDIEKKRRRAERFGTDLKISEAEKRRLRAARFNDGTKNGAAAVAAPAVVVEVGKGGAAKVPDSVKIALMEAESAKRKARAERFGSTQPEAALTPKFSKDAVTPKPKLSQDEEAKKKARMARFAMAAK
jgi:SAP domain-containing ribonucleoprotein